MIDQNDKENYQYVILYLWFKYLLLSHVPSLSDRSDVGVHAESTRQERTPPLAWNPLQPTARSCSLALLLLVCQAFDRSDGGVRQAHPSPRFVFF